MMAGVRVRLVNLGVQGRHLALAFWSVVLGEVTGVQVRPVQLTGQLVGGMPEGRLVGEWERVGAAVLVRVEVWIKGSCWMGIGHLLLRWLGAQ